MAYIREDGVIVMADGRLIYGNDPISISDLCELSQLLCVRPVVSGGAFPLGGPVSRKGSIGVQGFVGFPVAVVTGGPQGFAGSQGAQGSRGSQGVQGFSAQGVQGAQGAQGAQGFQGGSGFTGVADSLGFQGPQGVQGIQGVQGSQGSQGVLGFQGSQGSQGNQGFQGFGFQGPRGFEGPQNTVYRLAFGSVVVAAATTVTVYTATRGTSEKFAPALMVTENVAGAKFLHDAAASGADTCAGYFDRTAVAGEYRFKIENSNAISARTVNWAVLATKA